MHNQTYLGAAFCRRLLAVSTRAAILSTACAGLYSVGRYPDPSAESVSVYQCVRYRGYHPVFETETNIIHGWSNILLYFVVRLYFCFMSKSVSACVLLMI